MLLIFSTGVVASGGHFALHKPVRKMTAKMAVNLKTFQMFYAFSFRRFFYGQKRCKEFIRKVLERDLAYRIIGKQRKSQIR
jgi:hypothetical protein